MKKILTVAHLRGNFYLRGQERADPPKQSRPAELKGGIRAQN